MAAYSFYTCKLFTFGKPNIHTQQLIANQSKLQVQVPEVPLKGTARSFDCHLTALDPDSDYNAKRKQVFWHFVCCTAVTLITHYKSNNPIKLVRIKKVLFDQGVFFLGDFSKTFNSELGCL